jgi:broad specificity phosphatase PhoE
MPKLRRLVMVRHGETVGSSSVRFYGSSDVPLSDEGRVQLRQAAGALRTEVFDLVVASPLRRSWEGASIVSGGAPIRLVNEFREIDFGRWEGLTAREIEEAEPVLYREWQVKTAGFEFPGGESRAAFRDRVLRGLDRVLESGAAAALVVVHKGVIRTVAEELLGQPLAQGEPELASAVSLARGVDGAWFRGRRSSLPAVLEARPKLRSLTRR